jgi:hypothetical protein
MEHMLYAVGASVLCALVALLFAYWRGQRSSLAAQRAVLARKRWIKEPRFPRRHYRMFL